MSVKQLTKKVERLSTRREACRDQLGAITRDLAEAKEQLAGAKNAAKKAGSNGHARAKPAKAAVAN
jgi:chaperonin cofactor prefoldin